MEIEMEKSCRVCLQQSNELEAISNYLEAMKKVLDIGPNSILLTQESPALPNKICHKCIEIMSRQRELNKIAKASEVYFESHLLGYHGTFVKVEATECEVKDEESFSTMLIEELEPIDEAGLNTCNTDDSLNNAFVETKTKSPRKKSHKCLTCFKYFEKVNLKNFFS